MPKFILTPSPEDRIHISFISQRGKIRKFSIHYEALIGGRWRPIVRGDTAHDGWMLPHKHLYYLKKAPVFVELDETDYNQLYSKLYREITSKFSSFKDNYLSN